MNIIPGGVAFQLAVEPGKVDGVKNKLSLYFYISAGVLYFSLWSIFFNVGTNIPVIELRDHNYPNFNSHSHITLFPFPIPVVHSPKQGSEYRYRDSRHSHQPCYVK